tara:strand:+ start:5577 stop:5717 length:141 start_codon:yes stop_codon:yes gene_type:complete
VYKVWYCPIKKPIILDTIEEVITLSKMIEIVSGSTPYWEEFNTEDD